MSDERSDEPPAELAELVAEPAVPVAEPVAVPVAEPSKPALRRYHVALTPTEVLARLTEIAGVKAYDKHTLPDFGGLVEDAEFTLELGGLEQFTIHCGPPAARGQSATGMLRILYLRGTMTRTEGGTAIELGFAFRRPRWAMQRWFGFLGVASFGLLWVLIGPGDPSKKILLYGALVLVLTPVVIHDLRRGDQQEQQRLALLNLLEGCFGPIQIDESQRDEPYRRRTLGAPSIDGLARPERDDDEDEDEDEDEEGDVRVGTRR